MYHPSRESITKQPGNREDPAPGFLGTRYVPFHGMSQAGGDASSMTDEWNTTLNVCNQKKELGEFDVYPSSRAVAGECSEFVKSPRTYCMFHEMCAPLLAASYTHTLRPCLGVRP